MRDEDSRFDLLVCLSDGEPSAGPEMGKLLMDSKAERLELHLSRSCTVGWVQCAPLHTSVRLSGRPSNCSSLMISIVRTSAQNPMKLEMTSNL